MANAAPHASGFALIPPLGLGDILPCAPMRTSEFQIEGRLVTQSVWIDVRRYRWDERVEGPSAPSPQLSYLSLRLGERSQTRLALLPPRGDSRFMQPGEILYVPAGQQILARAAPSSERLVCFMFKPALGASLLKDEWSEVACDASLDLRNPNIRSGLTRLAQEALVPGFASDIVADALAASLIVELARHYRAHRAHGGEGAAGGTLAPWQLRLIRARVEDAEGALTLANLAADCRISTRHLSRAFKASIGMTLGEYIAQARIERARTMLAEGETSIKTVAFACGFQNQGAFASAFRRATGLTPRQFRKQYGSAF